MLLISTFVIDMDMLSYLDAVTLNGEDYIILQISELVGGEVMSRLMEKKTMCEEQLSEVLTLMGLRIHQENSNAWRMMNKLGLVFNMLLTAIFVVFLCMPTFVFKTLNILQQWKRI